MACLELAPPKALPKKWIAQCQSMRRGEPALKYLARYLYRGVIDERNILSEKDGRVSFRFKVSILLSGLSNIGLSRGSARPILFCFF